MLAKIRWSLVFAGFFICIPIALAAGGGSSAPSLPSATAPSIDAAAEYQKGLDALKAENYKEAQKAFDNVLSVNPKHAKGNFLAGFSRAQQGNYKAARKYYEKAVKYEDSLIMAHRELAVAYAKTEEVEKAQAVLDNLKNREKTCADTCAEAAELRSAISTIEAAMNPAPAAPTSQLRDTKSFIASSTENGDRAYIDAVSLIHEERYQQAIAELQKASATFGPHPDILTYIGFSYRKLGQFDTAEDYYRQALAVSPQHRGATEYYGELMVERGDLKGAREMLSKLEQYCTFGCAEADELRRWIDSASRDAS